MEGLSRFRAAALALLTAASCIKDSSDVPPDSNPSAAMLAACEEDDFQYLAFAGPAFDEAGKLKMPLPRGHIVATTAGWAKPDPELLEEVKAHNKDVMADVFGRDGLYGAGFAWSTKCGSSRSLSFWRDERSMMEFVLGKTHSAAITIIGRTTYGWETTHWTEDSSTEPTTFEAAKAKLAEVRQHP